MVTINVSSTATDTALVSLPVVFSPVTAVSLTTINLGVDVLTNVNYALSFLLFFFFVLVEHSSMLKVVRGCFLFRRYFGLSLTGRRKYDN